METKIFDQVYAKVYNRLCDLREDNVAKKADCLAEEALLEISKIAGIITDLVLAKEGYVCASQEEK